MFNYANVPPAIKLGYSFDIKSLCVECAKKQPPKSLYEDDHLLDKVADKNKPVVKMPVINYPFWLAQEVVNIDDHRGADYLSPEFELFSHRRNLGKEMNDHLSSYFKKINVNDEDWYWNMDLHRSKRYDTLNNV